MKTCLTLLPIAIAACCALAEQDVKFEYEVPDAIVIKGEHTKIFFPGSSKLLIKLSKLGLATNAKLRSKLFPDVVSQSKPIKDGTVEFLIDYSTQAFGDNPDLATVSVTHAPSIDETRIASFQIYPVRVELGDKHMTKEVHSITLDFMLDPDFDGKSAFKYRVFPWDAALSKHIYFMALPAFFTEAKLSFSRNQPADAVGVVKVSGEAKAPGMTAIVAMLGKDLWLDCSIKRLSVYLDFDKKVPLATSAPSKEEQLLAGKALDEIYPAPRDEVTQRGVAKLTEIFKAHRIPYLPQGLKSLSVYTRGSAIKNAHMPWEDLVLAAAEHSIRFAPLPPKPNINP